MESPEHIGLTITKAMLEPIESSINHTPDARTATRQPWQDRLTELAHLASASLGADSRDSNAGPLIHEHLDAIEAILRDPQPELAQEEPHGARRRSFRTKSLLGVSGAAELEEPGWLAKSRFDERQREEISCQLTTLLGEVTSLNQELQQRHTESIEIREVYEDRCRGLTRTIAELEDEVSEL